MQGASPLSDADRRPRVGVGVIVLNEKDEFLVGKRKGSNGAGAPTRPSLEQDFH